MSLSLPVSKNKVIYLVYTTNPIIYLVVRMKKMQTRPAWITSMPASIHCEEISSEGTGIFYIFVGHTFLATFMYYFRLFFTKLHLHKFVVSSYMCKKLRHAVLFLISRQITIMVCKLAHCTVHSFF